MLILKQIQMSYGNRTLFDVDHLMCQAGQRIAIVGANGAGKSTLLQIIDGTLEPCAGTVQLAEAHCLGVLQQDHYQYESDLVLEVVMQGDERLWQALTEKEQLLAKAEHTAADGYRLAECEDCILQRDGYTAESRAEQLLLGLGLSQDKQLGYLSELSGGWKLRVLLAQLLFKNPDVLLLDEPTNHLDIDSIAWLCRYLKREFKGCVLLVTHDRSLLDEVATDIWDVDYQTVTHYPVHFHEFVAMKTAASEQTEQQARMQQKQAAHLQEYIRRFGAKASKAKQAQSRQKMLDRMEMVQLKRSSRRSPYFKFLQSQKTGQEVVAADQLSKSFGEQLVLDQLSFSIKRGQRCAIIGPNGVGKSTLLKLLLGELSANHGCVTWHPNASVGYFAQNVHEALDEQQSCVGHLLQTVPGVDETLARRALGQMLFSGDDALKRISVLSGGEAARLLFAQLILQQNNILLLDEPTNHLDLEAIEGLVTGLSEYEGTVLLVSHNRYFVECVADCLLVLSPTAYDFYPGTYVEWIERQNPDFYS